MGNTYGSGGGVGTVSAVAGYERHKCGSDPYAVVCAAAPGSVCAFGYGRHGRPNVVGARPTIVQSVWSFYESLRSLVVGA